MMPIVLAVLVAAVVVAAGLMLSGRRRPRQESGVENFRRHIDALSPEARRAVMDRVKNNAEQSQPQQQSPLYPQRDTPQPPPPHEVLD